MIDVSTAYIVWENICAFTQLLLSYSFLLMFTGIIFLGKDPTAVKDWPFSSKLEKYVPQNIHIYILNFNKRPMGLNMLT